MSRAPPSTISLKDDFDFPMPKRETNWTIPRASGPHASVARQQAAAASSSSAPPARQTNSVADIEGAQAGTTAMFRSRRFESKPNLFNNSDIQGSSPTRHIPEKVNKDNTRNLRNEDIEHSFPESKLFSTPRVVNPLDPVYPLPVVRHRLPTPPPLKHETLKTSDIPGTQAKASKLRTQADRNPLDYSDVSLPQTRKRQSDSMALRTDDIIHAERDHVRQRAVPTNPLDPVYVVSGPNATREPIGAVAGSKPKGLPPARKDGAMFSLRSSDIEGATPGNRLPYPKVRREWKSTCDVSDIPGAHK